MIPSGPAAGSAGQAADSVPQPGDWLKRFRWSPRLAPLRTHLPIILVVSSAYLRLRGRRRTARAMGLVGFAGILRRYLVTRGLGRQQTEEHLRRMKRLRRSVMRHFYVTCIGSMEEEIETYPNYDRRKQLQRYELVAATAARYTPHGGVVVDVGCASGIVLDSLAATHSTRGIGFDLSPQGILLRKKRPAPPILAQAVVEHIPLRFGIADVVIFSEVIEHVLDADVALLEVARVTREGGILILTTNNASEMPEVSPLSDPLTWVERLVGRWRPQVLGFRNITWHEPINDPEDPLPEDAPTYVPHLHFAFVELRDLARSAGFDLVSSGSFEFPAPQSVFADWLRRLSQTSPVLGAAMADGLDSLAGKIPGIRKMGTHHLLVFRKSRNPAPLPRPWWLAQLPDEVITTPPGAAVGS